MSEESNTDEVMGREPSTIYGEGKENKCCPDAKQDFCKADEDEDEVYGYVSMEETYLQLVRLRFPDMEWNDESLFT